MENLVIPGEQYLSNGGREKVSFKTLRSYVAEYKALPIYSELFESVHKKLFE